MEALSRSLPNQNWLQEERKTVRLFKSYLGLKINGNT